MLKDETRKILLEITREISKLRSDVDLITQRLAFLESRLREIEHMVRLLEVDV